MGKSLKRECGGPGTELAGEFVCLVAAGSGHTAVATDDGKMYTWVEYTPARAESSLAVTCAIWAVLKK